MTAPTTCPKCGTTIEPTPCTCGTSHVGTYCWPCHHARVSSCAAPHCPEHGVIEKIDRRTSALRPAVAECPRCQHPVLVKLDPPAPEEDKL